MKERLEGILQQNKKKLKETSTTVFYTIPSQIQIGTQIPTGYPWPQQPPIVIGPQWPNTEPQPKFFPGIYDFPELPVKPIIRDPVEKYAKIMFNN